MNKIFKKLLSIILSLFIILNLFLPIESLGISNNSCFNSSRFDDGMFEKNGLTSEVDIINEINKCENKIKELTNDLGIFKYGNVVKIAIPLGLGAISGFISKLFKSLSLRKASKPQKQSQGQNNNFENVKEKKQTWNSVCLDFSTVSLVLLPYIYYYIFQKNIPSKEAKLLREKIYHDKLLKKYKNEF